MGRIFEFDAAGKRDVQADLHAGLPSSNVRAAESRSPDLPPAPASPPPLKDGEPEPSIRLDHFLQQCGAAMTGGHAKLMIQSGEIFVDGVVETRRRFKLRDGMIVGTPDGEFDVAWDDADR